jgi:Asp-tRNA(Asn)/Glu-tRNA(Gln) amidotransferase A subunit family amidase
LINDSSDAETQIDMTVTVASPTKMNDHVARNREINAIVEWLLPNVMPSNSATGAAFQASSLEESLRDWTFAIKSNIAVKGAKFTAGIGAYRNRVAQEDAFAITLLRAAGANIVGIANMEEAALGATTNNPHFGATHNPHSHGYTAGGSSGGSAAAVAAGFVRAALGTDTMGSCRLPAAYCGVVGFKPSFGRISTRGVEPLSRQLDHVGVFANSVSDVASVFRVLNVFDVQSADARSYAYRNQTMPETPHPEPSFKALFRVAVLDSAAQSALESDVRSAYQHALNTLKAQGVQLIEKPIDVVALARARRAGLLLCESELATTLGDALAGDAAGVSVHLRALIAFGASKSAADLAEAEARIAATEQVLRDQLDGIDCVIWPTAPQTAFPLASDAPANQADYTCLANFTGAPAISIPATQSNASASLPVGLQLMMPRGEDWALLNAAQQIEKTFQS